MTCLTPVTIVRPYRRMGRRYEDAAVPVPCGKCPVCLINRQKDWIFRMTQELKRSTTASFITLTYEMAPITENGLLTLDHSHVQKFLKRLRKQQHLPIKYYAVGEYGSKYGRPHYHLIIFNLKSSTILRGDSITDLWHAGTWAEARPGITQLDACTSGSIGYVAGYCHKGSWKPVNAQDDRKPHYSAMSKGIGLNYLSETKYNYHKKNLIAYVTNPGGHLQRLPRYFKDKIFTKQEKDEIQKLTEEWLSFNMDDFVRDSYDEVQRKKNHIHLFERKQKLERQKL